MRSTRSFLRVRRPGMGPLASLGGAGKAGPRPIPLLANLVTRFSADAITPQANNSSLPSWTDSVNSIAAGTVVGTAPLYTTNRLNAKPSVKCLLGGLSIATPGALKTAIDSLDFTVFIVFRTLGAAGNGCLFGATVGGDSFFYTADGTSVQKFSSMTAVPYAGQTAFSTFGSTSFNTTPNFSSTGKFQSFYINGGAVSSAAVGAVGTGGNTLCIGDNAANTVPVNAEIFDILVWNVPLTPAQYMQAQMWACDKYAQPYPWAGLTSFNTFFGDSIVQGVGATLISKQAPYLAAQTLGLTFGQWHNIGVGGIWTQNMNVLAPTWVDPIAALIGKKHNLVGFEWHNENLLGSGQATPPGPFNDANTYLAARKLIANQRTVWGTSTGESTDPIANRTSYNASFDGAHPANLIDSYMALHTSTDIGTTGANAAHPTYWSDTVHLSDLGYPFLATLFVNGINALP